MSDAHRSFFVKSVGSLYLFFKVDVHTHVIVLRRHQASFDFQRCVLHGTLSKVGCLANSGERRLERARERENQRDREEEERGGDRRRRRERDENQRTHCTHNLTQMSQSLPLDSVGRVCFHY